ncbi:MAG: sensor histidine kinase [Candidatus Humimicrobiaceae bacterium]
MRNLTIRSKITLWYASLLLILLVIFNIFIYMTISKILYQNNEDLLKSDAHQVFLLIQSEGFNINFDVPYKIISTNTYFVIFDVNGNAGFKSEILPEIVNLPINLKQFRNVFIDRTNWIVYDAPVKNNGEVIGWIRVSRSLQSLMNTLLNLKIIMFISVPLYGLLASAGGLFLAKRALRPIDYITKTAHEISKGDLTQRLKLNKTEDEVGRLATTFDEMLDKLENSIKKERQFASDASHELRTPISIITAQAEEVLTGKHEIEEYKEAIEMVRDEGKKMSHIISQLLMIYRSDEGRYKFHFEILNLNMIIEDIVNEFGDVAKDKGITVYFKAEEEIKIKADQTLLTRLFINIIDNAIKYTNRDGKINISLSKINNCSVIITEDTGIGISEKNIPYIFDRLYQVDKSREDRGTGLGLAIAKSIAELHKGEILVESKLNTGSKFIIKLPLNL